MNPAILWIGAADLPEFSAPLETLRAGGTLYRLDDLAAALEWLHRTDVRPTHVVLGQRWPGEHPAAGLDRLRRCLPLAPIMVVRAPWCEDEGRTGTPLVGVDRVMWHAAVERLSAWLDPRSVVTADVRMAPRWLPVTARDEERWLHGARLAPAVARGLVLIAAQDAAWAQSLVDGCARWGHGAVASSDLRSVRVSPPDWGLWDAPHDPRGAELSWHTWQAAWSELPTVVLLHMPRLDDQRRWFERGAAAILAKPFRWDELDRLGRRLAEGRRHARRAA